MPGTARHRDSDYRRFLTGTYFNLYGTPQTRTDSCFSGLKKDIWDVVGNTAAYFNWKYQPNPLTITHVETDYPTLSGSYILGGVVYRKFDNFPIGNRPNAEDPGFQFPLSALDKSNYAFRIIGGTTPNTPNVSLPTFVAELKDVPELTHRWGNSLLKRMAKGHLSWRWGLKPMINEVRGMLHFVDAVNNRVADLERLRSGGTLRKRCSLGSASYPGGSQFVVIHSEGAFIRAIRTTTYTSKVWGSAQWKLHSTASLPRRFDPRVRKLAWRLVTGVTTYEALATAWELLPWSWFYDWFFHFGEIIAGANNTVPVTWANLCLMRTLSSHSTYDIERTAPSDTWPTVHGRLETRMIRKERHLVAPDGPPVTVLGPLLQGKTWSILGALAILRTRNRLL